MHVEGPSGSTFHTFFEEGYDDVETRKPGYVFDVERDMGFTVLNDFDEVPLIVKTVKPKSWADRHHIHRGDVIIQIGD